MYDSSIAHREGAKTLVRAQSLFPVGAKYAYHRLAAAFVLVRLRAQ
jgi:hypothetical protein